MLKSIFAFGKSSTDSSYWEALERKWWMFSAFILKAYSENWQPVSCRLARESHWFIVLHDAHAWKQHCIWSSHKEQWLFARNSCCFWFLSKHFFALLVFCPEEQSEQIGLILNETLAVFLWGFYFFFPVVFFFPIFGWLFWCSTDFAVYWWPCYSKLC